MVNQRDYAVVYIGRRHQRRRRRGWRRSPSNAYDHLSNVVRNAAVFVVSCGVYLLGHLPQHSGPTVLNQRDVVIHY